ncbi:MAG TPA: acyl-CoA dehydrogenase family protein [Alphaproteobacteria bacterium]|jgi:acyl-CoA dehydrogenase|nr:acyl-CoA dehydrogenase family protein [Alphaproteobacteria bacterium]HJM49700.1 acyl-CoA dehydrogenase family protein [Alphaproteobacteria bacterium]
MADKSFLEWPFFAHHHRDLAQRIEAFAASELAPLLELADDSEATLDATCRELVATLGRAGFLAPCVVADEGGRFDVRSLCLSREILARLGGLADFSFAMQGLGSAPISLFGTAEQKAHYLPPVAGGEHVAAFALSEQNAGSDVAAMATTAEADGADYVLNGSKTWISNGGIADTYVVFARSGEAGGARGLSAFIVEAGTPGFEIAGRIPLMAPHPIATLAFTDCRVPAANRLGGPGEGFKIAMATLDVFRTTVGAAALGFARRAFDEALGRTREREMFGQQLVDFQLTQAAIGDMAVGIDTSALAVYRAAWTRDTTGRRISREASVAKFHATETAQHVIDTALQLHGGLGVVKGQAVEALYRDIRALRIYEGASEVQKLIIAGAILKGDGQ